MRLQTLWRRQWTPRPLAKAFTDFSDVRNLVDITPPGSGFRMLTAGAIRMAPGAKISYRLRVHGLPNHWTTEIRQWLAPRRLVDVQLSGTYALWHHTHRFDALNGGARMSDVDRYRLPFGPLGRRINALMVRRDVKQIFDYREQRIRELFGEAGRLQVASPHHCCGSARTCASQTIPRSQRRSPAAAR
jgi:ligand-binding SRPBCC domain-containing protein